MTFSDRPTVSNAKKLGCALYAFLSIPAVFFFLLLAALGHNECSYEPDLSGCEWDGVRRFLLFPGSLIVAVLGAVFVARWAVKDED